MPHTNNSPTKSKDKKEVTGLRALTDTSSVVAHDLCAQLHVMQFCLEELQDHVDGEGKEYLKRMGASTSYISRLVDSFRRSLKVTVNDTEPFPLDEIYEGALDLLKNHYFTILERMAFTTTGDLEDLKVKNDGRKLLHMIFTLYSFYMDEVRSDEEEQRFTFTFNFKAQLENSRFAKITIETKGRRFPQSFLAAKLDRTIAEKGKIRQFLGVSTLKEAISENPEFITFKELNDGNTVEMMIPLERGE